MMKKSLSLVLALALVLGMTAIAAPSTEIYFARFFDEYNTVGEFLSEMTPTTYTLSHGAANNASGEMLAHSKLIQDFDGANGGLYSFGSSNVTAANTAFETNKLGRTTFRTATGSLAYNAEAGMVVIPKKSWNFEENPDEIFIISYDLEVNPGITALQLYHGDQTYWCDPAKTKTLQLNAMWRNSTSNGSITYGANGGRVFSSGALNYAFAKDTTHRVAYGFTYGSGNQYTDDYNADTMGQTYYVPTRYYFRDGGYWTATGNKYSSTQSYGEGKINGNTVASHSWVGRPVLFAFTLTWAGTYGIEYSDLIAYTVSADPATFTAEMVEDTIEVGDSAVVKFSQPIAPKTAVKEAFTMTENGEAFTAFEVGEVETVVDDATGEVYTTVEFLFPYGQKTDSTYGINIKTEGTMVKSEIMRTVASGNNLTFTTGSAPENLVTLSGKGGLEGDAEDVTSITSQQAKFTATAAASEKPAYLFIGVYDDTDNLVSYTYTTATTGDALSLATKVESGYTVKAFSCGSVYDLTQVFGTPGTPIN